MVKPTTPGSRRLQQAGFTYIAVLAAVAIIGIVLAAAGEVWHQSRQREKERELLFIGNQFRQAIGLYYHRTPLAGRRYPETLDDLLEDKRYITTQRYLRRIFRDPMTGNADWVLIEAPGGGIMGVHSRSNARPIKQGDFRHGEQTYSGANSYAEWRFSYEPLAPSAEVAPPSGNPQSRPGIR